MHGLHTRPIIADATPPYHYPFLRQGHSLSFPKVIAPLLRGRFTFPSRAISLLFKASPFPSPKVASHPTPQPLVSRGFDGAKKRPTVGR